MKPKQSAFKPVSYVPSVTIPHVVKPVTVPEPVMKEEEEVLDVRNPPSPESMDIGEVLDNG